MSPNHSLKNPLRGSLSGKTIVVTRSEKQASDMIQLIESKGGKAYPFAVIETRWVEDLGPLDQAIDQLETYDWVMITSVNTIDYFISRLELKVGLQQALSILHKKKIAAIGPKTAQAIENRGLSVEVVPATFKQEDLVEACRAHMQVGMKILYPRAEVARRELGEQFRRMGMIVDELPIYQTVSASHGKEAVLQKMKNKEIDVITFTSSSTVKNFVTILEGTSWREEIQEVVIACIGPITAQTATKLGLQVDIEAKQYTAEALINEIEKYYALNQKD